MVLSKNNVLLTVFVIGQFFSCKKRDNNETANVKNEVSTLTRDIEHVYTPESTISSSVGVTYGFHWTTEDVPESNPASHMRSVVRWATTLATHDKSNWKDNLCGPGMYLAADPFSTQKFGDTLLIVPIKPNSKVLVSKMDQSLCADKSLYDPTKLLMYPYQSNWNSGGHTFDYAVVARNEDVIVDKEIQMIKFDWTKVCDVAKLPTPVDVTGSVYEQLKQNPGLFCIGSEFVEKLDFTDVMTLALLGGEMEEQDLATAYPVLGEVKELAEKIGKKDLNSIAVVPFCKTAGSVEKCAAVLHETLADMLYRSNTDRKMKLSDVNAVLMAMSIVSAPATTEREVLSNIRKTFCAQSKEDCARADKIAKIYAPTEIYRRKVFKNLLARSMLTWK